MRKLALVVVLATSCQRNVPPPVAPRSAMPTGPSAPDQLARGTYIAALAGCATCHGAPGGTLAGGKSGRLGNGTWFAPNITPDRETGIGAWTDRQIDEAIRLGIGNGVLLAPLMPYPFYHRMTDGDVAATIAFLRAQPPVRNEVARSKDLPVQHVDLLPPVGNVDRRHDPLAHGEYLAAIMHCAACHTPTAGPFAGVPFAGGTELAVEGKPIIAPNITSDPQTGLGTWSEAQIVAAVRAMSMPDGTSIREPMAGYRDDWAVLADEDAHALATYVMSIPPVHHEIEGAAHPAVTSVP